MIRILHINGTNVALLQCERKKGRKYGAKWETDKIKELTWTPAGISRQYFNWSERKREWRSQVKNAWTKFIPFTISISNTHTNLLAPWLVYASALQCRNITREKNRFQHKTGGRRGKWTCFSYSRQIFTPLRSIYSVNSSVGLSFELFVSCLFICIWLHFLFVLLVRCLCIWNFRKQNAV